VKHEDNSIILLPLNCLSSGKLYTIERKKLGRKGKGKKKLLANGKVEVIKFSSSRNKLG